MVRQSATREDCWNTCKLLTRKGMVRCVGYCRNSYHVLCLGLSVNQSIGENWTCKPCKDRTAQLQQEWTRILREKAESKRGSSLGNSLVKDTNSNQVDKTDYPLESIINHRRCIDGNLEYQVRWLGYGPEHDLWLKESEFANAYQTLWLYKIKVRLGPPKIPLPDDFGLPKPTDTKRRHS